MSPHKKCPNYWNNFPGKGWIWEAELPTGFSSLKGVLKKKEKDDIFNGRFLVYRPTIATEISSLKRFQNKITLFIEQVKETVGHSGLGIILNNTPHFFYNENFPIPPPTSIPPFLLPTYQLSVSKRTSPPFFETLLSLHRLRVRGRPIFQTNIGKYWHLKT